jgi:hypothetical protein
MRSLRAALAAEPPTFVDSVPKEARRDSSGARGLPGGIVVARWWAAFASLGAGLIHLAVVSEHVAEWWLYGVFFLALGAVQIAWAVQTMEGDALSVPRLFATVNAAVIGLWVVSRTIGLPVGPEPWAAEPVGRADVVASALEAVVVVFLVVAVRRRQVQESRALTKPLRWLVAIGAVGVAAVTLVAIAAHPPVLHGSHHRHAAPLPGAQLSDPPSRRPSEIERIS